MRHTHLTRTTTLLGLVGLATLLGAGSCSSIDEELREEFVGRLGSGVTISVYPAAVRRAAGFTYDGAAAERVAALLREHGLAVAQVVSAEVPLPSDGGKYQADVWKSSSAAFTEWLASHPSPGEYALLAEYLISPTPQGKEFAGGIHAYVLDRQGRLVEGFLLNSHHEAFRAAAASTADECTTVLLGELKRAWVDERQR